MPYRLFLGISVHRVPTVVAELLDFGDDQVAKVDVTFLQGQKPIGTLEGPSPAFVEDKVECGRSWIRRWFD